MKSSPRNRNSSGEISIFLQWGWEVHWFQSVICLLSVDTVLSSAELICLEVKWFNILYVYALVECKNESLWAWPFSRCSNNWFFSSPNLINWEEQLQLSEQVNCVYLWALSHILCGPLICVYLWALSHILCGPLICVSSVGI
jgi:hypothetical protein